MKRSEPHKHYISDTGSTPPLSSNLCVVGADQINQIAPAWRELTESGAFAEPFFQPEWFTAYAQTLEPLKEITLVSVHQGERLRAIAPFVSSDRFFGHIPARSLRSLSGIHSCRFDIAHNGANPHEISAAVWRTLADRRDWEVLEALDVPHNGTLMHVLEHAQASGYLVGTWPTRKSPYLLLPKKGRDPYESCPKDFKSFRNRLRSKHKKLAQEGAVSFEAYTDEYETPLRAFLALEASGWKSKNGSAIASQLPLIRFYSQIAKECSERGRLRIYALTLDSKPIAMHLGLMMNGSYYAPKVAYDEDFARFSPGQLLVHNVIPDLVSHGVQRYDFLGPRALWKRVWTDQVREHYNCYIFRPTLKGRALHALTLRLGSLCKRLRYKLRGDPQKIPIGTKTK